MGLIKRKKKPPIDEASERVQHFFDEYFREELKKRGREYFEKVIDDNAAVFKKELDATIVQVYTELKTRLTMELDDQFVEYGKGIKETQEAALKSMTHSAKDLIERHEKLSAKMQKNISEQDDMLNKSFEGHMIQITAMKNAQYDAVQTLNGLVKSMEQQQEQLNQALQKRVLYQESLLVGGFEQNMAQIIEHYLLGALGDQYDMKAQLPSIIKQMEANKKDIVDDMKL